MGDVGFANRMKAVAEKLAGKFAGKSLVLRKVSEDSVLVDPNDPSKGFQKSFTDHPFFGTILDYQNKEIDGDLVWQGDRKCLFPLSIEERPKVDDIIIDGDEQLHIIYVGKTEVAGVDILYTLQLRG